MKIKELATIVAVTGSIFMLPACNTVDGAVDDVESVGDCADGQPGNC